MDKVNDLKNVLNQYGQTHLLGFYDKLQNNEQQQLLNQISKIDFSLVKDLYNMSKEEEIKKTIVKFEGMGSSVTQGDILIANQIENPMFGKPEEKHKKEKLQNEVLSFNADLMKKIYNMSEDKKVDSIEPIEHIKMSELTNEEKDKYEKIGVEVIKRGEYAVVTMAGGQGTRLGHRGPKGSYMLDLNPPISLFEILCNRLKEIKEQYGVVIPWYIMTSKENNNDTIKFFEDNKYFDYPKDAVKFFMQGELPMLFKNGNIVLEEPWKIKEGADGHGGIFTALKKNQIIDEMKKKNIKWFFVCGIDNILAKLVDLVFLGMTVDQNVLVASKSVVKDNPSEKVGVFCLRNGRPSVVEYTEISEEMSNQVNEKGELRFGDANILAHIFNIDLMTLLEEDKLPYHVALKKTEYVDENGNIHQGDAYKFESFIFDAFYKAEKMLVLRVKREEEFAPIKNAEGTDSPATAKELYQNYIKTFK